MSGRHANAIVQTAERLGWDMAMEITVSSLNVRNAPWSVF